MSWRNLADWAKRKPITLQLADRLGRSRARFSLSNHIYPPPTPRRPDLTKWTNPELAAAWLGHATLLLRVGGMTVLTDPVFSNRVGLGLGLFTGGPKRLAAPALALKDLPAIDLILISHAHFDHLDRPTLFRLPKTIPVVTAAHNRDLVDDLGFRQVDELRWGESIDVGSLRVTAHQPKHWGARTFADQHRGYNSYLIESLTDRGRRVFYGGDTAFTDGFRDVGPVNLAILGIGAYDPYIAAHATPEQAWEMSRHLQADHVLPIHHSTFRLSYEPIHEPMQRILTAAGPNEQQIVVREIGGQWSM